tara:strand:+ start:804 stop:1778 length:975 start_codon:yes stop_codon:yes gene_type:complete
MIKIYITCPWQDAPSILDKYKKNTPGNKGVWKNIQAVTNYNEADYLIVLDNLYKDIVNLGEEHFLNKFDNFDKIIHFQRENTGILKYGRKNWYLNNILPKLKHHITYDKGFLYTFAPASFINKTYDELKSMKYPNKTKNISCVVSSKQLNQFTDGYFKRTTFIRKYSQLYPNKIDIYGRGWNKYILGDNYKGTLGSYHQEKNITTDKSNALLDYHYSIALENFYNERLISEKITDCILCWTLPLYWGNSCTNLYLPEKSFRLINIENKDIFKNIQNIISKAPTDEEVNALTKAREIILDKLNIWEQIYQIINNYDTFLKEYKLY